MTFRFNPVVPRTSFKKDPYWYLLLWPPDMAGIEISQEQGQTDLAFGEGAETLTACAYSSKNLVFTSKMSFRE